MSPRLLSSTPEAASSGAEASKKFNQELYDTPQFQEFLKKVGGADFDLLKEDDLGKVIEIQDRWREKGRLKERIGKVIAAETTGFLGSFTAEDLKLVFDHIDSSAVSDPDEIKLLNEKSVAFLKSRDEDERLTREISEQTKARGGKPETKAELDEKIKLLTFVVDNASKFLKRGAVLKAMNDLKTIFGVELKVGSVHTDATNILRSEQRWKEILQKQETARNEFRVARNFLVVTSKSADAIKAVAVKKLNQETSDMLGKRAPLKQKESLVKRREIMQARGWDDLITDELPPEERDRWDALKSEIEESVRKAIESAISFSTITEGDKVDKLWSALEHFVTMKVVGTMKGEDAWKFIVGVLDDIASARPELKISINSLKKKAYDARKSSS